MKKLATYALKVMCLSAVAVSTLVLLAGPVVTTATRAAKAAEAEQWNVWVPLAGVMADAVLLIVILAVVIVLSWPSRDRRSGLSDQGLDPDVEMGCQRMDRMDRLTRTLHNMTTRQTVCTVDSGGECPICLDSLDGGVDVALNCDRPGGVRVRVSPRLTHPCGACERHMHARCLLRHVLTRFVEDEHGGDIRCPTCNAVIMS